jgi:hypothetical protein
MFFSREEKNETKKIQISQVSHTNDSYLFVTFFSREKNVFFVLNLRHLIIHGKS